MARADSTVRVSIIGDAKGLTRELDKADGKLKGFGSSAAKVGAAIGTVVAADQIVDFANTALSEFDRIGDATARLEKQLGEDLAAALVDSAEDWHELGLSAQDALELEASIADVATALGVAAPDIASLADDTAATAAALSLVTDLDADTAIDLIGKAAAGSDKAMRALGVSVTDAEVEARALRDTGKQSADALTDNELATARWNLVLEDLKPFLDDAVQGTGDLEQKQRELEAKFETLTGKIGGALEGPLADFLDWTLSGIEGWEMLGDALSDAKIDLTGVLDVIRTMIAPFTTLLDVTQGIADALGQIGAGPPRSQSGRRSVSPSSFGGGGTRSSGPTVVNITTGADPEEIATAIRSWDNRV